mgnify:FL=1
MNTLRKLLDAFSLKKKAYRLELPIGLELSDGNRANLYGWPDLFIQDVHYECS